MASRAVRTFVNSVYLICCTYTAPAKSEQTVVRETMNYPPTELMFERMKNVSTQSLSLPQWEKGEPVQVYIGFYVESLSNFRTTDMSFDMDMYFSMSWQDQRLTHDYEEPYLITDPMQIKRIWRPDIYFANAKSAKYQDVTVPNVYLRVFKNGDIFMSRRITLTVACNQNLRKYPMDSQRCGLRILSYSHIEGKVRLNWVPDNPIERNLEIKLPELRVVETESTMCTTEYTYAQTENYKMKGNFSCLEGILCMKREIGYHLTQTYIPTILIVVISWVSFFIDPSAVPARVSLSFTTLLTLSTMSTGVRVALPPVAYAKAIDVWMGACTGFVFVTLIQFALVNAFMRRAIHFSQLMKNTHVNERKIRELQHLLPPEMVGLMSVGFTFFFARSASLGTFFDGYNEGFRQGDIAALLHRLSDVNRQRAKKIDMACRFLFPIGFVVFNVFYWISYSIGDD